MGNDSYTDADMQVIILYDRFSIIKKDFCHRNMDAFAKASGNVDDHRFLVNAMEGWRSRIEEIDGL